MKAIAILILVLGIACSGPSIITPQPPPPPGQENQQPLPTNAKWVAPKVKFQPPLPPYSSEELKGAKGSVVVQFEIGTDGLPSKIKSVEGPSICYRLAEDYVSNWIFYPALIDGKPSPSWFRLTVSFKPR